MKRHQIITQSPGRINIIGEHTDYNEGFVLPAAIDKKTRFHITKNNTANTVNVTAENMKASFSFDLTSFSPVGSGWENYVMGVVHELQQIGANLRGFDCKFSGDVPIGGGMSSSASLEVSFAYGLNELFQLGFGQWQIIKACQMAEHNFVGIKCGIMDQFASMMGKKNQAMLLDCRSLEFEYHPVELDDYQLILLNTNVSHSLASSAYNDRRASCEEGVRIFQQYLPNIQSLRDVTLAQLTQYADKLPHPIHQRCKHIINENNRVIEATKALQSKDLKKLGYLLYQSHDSLQYDFEISCPELDFLVEQTRSTDKVLGSRMMGGGFGGCTINLVQNDFVEQFINQTSQRYLTQIGIELTPYRVSIEDGASIKQLA